MPYIVKKRSDIPDGVLQITDLTPNVSLRNEIYDPAGRTGYRRNIQNDRPSLSSSGGVITFAAEATGLTAWFLTNVTDGSGVAATGAINVVAGASLVDGETVTISDGTTSVVFEFNSGGGVTGSNVAVAFTGGSTATNVRDALISAINGVSGFNITASITDADTLALTNDSEGTAGNVTITDTVANVGFTTSGMTGGTDSDALTVAEAVQNATDVLDLLGYDDGATSAGDLALADINGAITTGAITSGQVVEILRILSGESYVVPSGVQIEASSAFDVSPAVDDTDGPYFDTTTVRETYDTFDLHASAAEGVLAGFIDDDFEYAGEAGAALVVYADDGTIFVP